MELTWEEVILEQTNLEICNLLIMKHLFMPYELALQLKEKGFDEPCLAYWSTYNKSIPELVINEQSKGNWSLKEDYCTAPLYQQVIDWFETKGIYISINTACYSVPIWSDWCVQRIEPYTEVFSEQDESYENKYEALNKAIEEALKHIP